MEEIKAINGKYLTQSEDVAQTDRIFVTAVYTHDVTLWRDATQQERDAYDAEQASKSEVYTA